MPGEGNGPTSGTTASSGDTPGLVPNQLAVLVPTFDPAKDDVIVYSQKVQLLLHAWPDGRWSELATRLILGCAGSAFMKLQIHQEEVTRNEKKSIERIITILGGQWGQINLEKQYEYAERAIYRCYQKGDEGADSYLARADILWSELKAKGVTLDDLQPYVTLRGSQLSSEDKKKVLIDVDAANTGKLTIAKVSSAIRMLGASFFHDMTGQKKTRGKTYDQGALLLEDVDMDDFSQPAFAAEATEAINEDDWMDSLIQEGDEDATLVADFEDSVQEIVQADEELAATYTAYTDARKRLSDKFKSRGFWPSSFSQKGGKGKGGFKGVKGKFNKGGSASSSSSRKSLQQRILESRCRLCNRIGHWKAECPFRTDSASSASRSTGAPTSFTQAHVSNEVDHLPLEFLQLPEFSPSLDEPLPLHSAECFSLVANPSNRIRSYLLKLKQSTSPIRHDVRNEKMTQSSLPHDGSLNRDIRSNRARYDQEVLCFASHGSLGVVDLGATKTVIGSNHVQELLDHLHPELKGKIYRCKCEITFRFGNHGTLKSQHALVIPIHGFHLKVAVVQGSTPFLLSNTLLRALGAVIDTSKKELFASKIDRVIPLHLTEKGLFLLDLNDLAPGKPGQTVEEGFAETHTVTEPKDSPRESQGLDQREKSEHHNQTERLDNPSEPQSNLPGPQVSRSEDHKSIDIETTDPSMLATQEDQSHRSFARSLSLPNRTKHHVDLGQATLSRSGACGRDHARSQPILDSGPRENDDPIWEGPFGRYVPRSLGQRSGLDRVVHFPPGEITEDSASSPPPLHRVDGGACGTHPEGSSCEDITKDPARSWSGSWEVITTPQGKGQGPGNKFSAGVTRIDDSRADGRACRGERGARSQRHVRDHPTGRDVPRGSSGDTDASYGECPLASDQPPGESDSQDGVTVSDEQLPAHLLHEAETGQGIRFKQQLAMRETARRAFHSADNDAALRRAALRRSRPGVIQYHPMEWVMVWKQSNGALPNQWIGPMRIVVHENSQTIWTTMGSKLYRSAPEHIRPVTAHEARGIQITKDTPSVSIIAQQLQELRNQGTTQAIQSTMIPTESPIPVAEQQTPQIEAPEAESSQQGSQPDGEPGIPGSQPSISEGDPEDNQEVNPPGAELEGTQVPIPDSEDDNLTCECLLSVDTEPTALEEPVENLAWRW